MDNDKLILLTAQHQASSPSLRHSGVATQVKGCMFFTFLNHRKLFPFQQMSTLKSR